MSNKFILSKETFENYINRVFHHEVTDIIVYVQKT